MYELKSGAFVCFEGFGRDLGPGSYLAKDRTGKVHDRRGSRLVSEVTVTLSPQTQVTESSVGNDERRHRHKVNQLGTTPLNNQSY